MRHGVWGTRMGKRKTLVRLPKKFRQAFEGNRKWDGTEWKVGTLGKEQTSGQSYSSRFFGAKKQHPLDAGSFVGKAHICVRNNFQARLRNFFRLTHRLQAMNPIFNRRVR